MREDLQGLIRKKYPKMMANVVDITIRDVTYDESPTYAHQASFHTASDVFTFYFNDADDFKKQCTNWEKNSS